MKRFALAALVGLVLAGCCAVEPAEQAYEHHWTCEHWDCGHRDCDAIVEKAEQVPDDDWTRKPAAVPLMRIGRGVTNVALSPLELPTTMWRVANEFDEFGYGAGVFQGLFNVGSRLIWGAGEACTFFFITDPDPVYDFVLGERIIFRENYHPAEMSAASGGATKPGHKRADERRVTPQGERPEFVTAEQSSAGTPSSPN